MRYNPWFINENWAMYTQNDEVLVDFFVRYEHLEADLAEVSRRIGLERNLYEDMRSISAKRGIRPASQRSAAAHRRRPADDRAPLRAGDRDGSATARRTSPRREAAPDPAVSLPGLASALGFALLPTVAALNPPALSDSHHQWRCLSYVLVMLRAGAATPRLSPQEGCRSGGRRARRRSLGGSWSPARRRAA